MLWTEISSKRSRKEGAPWICQHFELLCKGCYTSAISSYRFHFTRWRLFVLPPPPSTIWSWRNFRVLATATLFYRNSFAWKIVCEVVSRMHFVGVCEMPTLLCSLQFFNSFLLANISFFFLSGFCVCLHDTMSNSGASGTQKKSAIDELFWLRL